MTGTEQGFFTEATSAEVVISRNARAGDARLAEVMAVLIRHLHQTVQQYVGSTRPVLMDWAVGLAFPCQQPMLHTNGVTEVPQFRITPDDTF